MCVMPVVMSTQPEDIAAAGNPAVKTLRKAREMSLFLNALEWQFAILCLIWHF